MEFDRAVRERRSIRLRGYDYTQPGSYFVTTCAVNRKLLFGEIVAGQMRMNDQGRIVHEEWFRTSRIRPEIALGAFVVMPNHIHSIITILPWVVGANRRVAQLGPTRRVAPTRPTGPGSGSLGAIIGQIKSVTTKRINLLRGTPRELVWQRNYYEHVIRSDRALERIREYICMNPERWLFDPENPSALSRDTDELEDIFTCDAD